MVKGWPMRAAAKARRALDLDQAIKATQRILLAGKTGELERAKEEVLEQLDALERQIASLTAQVSEKASEVENQRGALDELVQAQERRSRAVLGLDQRLGLVEQDRGFQLERIQEAEAAQAELRKRLETRQQLRYPVTEGIQRVRLQGELILRVALAATDPNVLNRLKKETDARNLGQLPAQPSDNPIRRELSLRQRL